MPIPSVHQSQSVISTVQNQDSGSMSIIEGELQYTNISPGTSTTSGSSLMSDICPHHHHSTTITDISPLLPVHHDSQLEVLLPISSNSTDVNINSPVSNSNSQHQMVTRLKSGTIIKKNYAAYLATFLELQSLQTTEDKPFSSSFSFVTEVSKCTKPSSFRKAYSIPQWQQAM